MVWIDESPGMAESRGWGGGRWIWQVNGNGFI